MLSLTAMRVTVFDPNAIECVETCWDISDEEKGTDLGKQGLIAECVP